METSKKSALLILDGWGLGPDPKVDAIARADTPYFDQLIKTYPNSTLVTHGLQVGLPEGQMGNSEVGHLNIGAGRIVYQQFARINKAIEDGTLAKNTVLLENIERAVSQGKDIHLFGLLSDGGVHSHIKHLEALIDIIEAQGAEKIFIHAFMDGRDTDPHGGFKYLEGLQKFLTDKKSRLASVIGRYYAMDRDKRWERVKLAYDLLVKGEGEQTQDVLTAVQKSYEDGITDEFIEPIVVNGEDDQPIALIKDGDLAICFNFRTDRPREISQVLTQEDMPDFDMKKLDLDYVTMTRYNEAFTGISVLFDNEDLVNTMGEVLADKGKTQVRIAETEKYPHVTFFFNGGREEAFDGEKRIMKASPKVATYDLQPEMSAPEITEGIIEEINSASPDFICLNYANTDMVGHTGVFEAVVKAAETVDHCLEQLIPVLLENQYYIMIIADHGNGDFMVNEDGSPNTAHTKNPVPCILVAPGDEALTLKDGKLADLAPTLLHLMNIEIPPEMDGEILV